MIIKVLISSGTSLIPIQSCFHIRLKSYFLILPIWLFNQFDGLTQTGRAGTMIRSLILCDYTYLSLNYLIIADQHVTCKDPILTKFIFELNVKVIRRVWLANCLLFIFEFLSIGIFPLSLSSILCINDQNDWEKETSVEGMIEDTSWQKKGCRRITWYEPSPSNSRTSRI